MRFVFVLIAVLLGINNVFVLKRIGFLSYDRFLEIMIFLFFLKSYIQEIKQNQFFRKFNRYLLAFILIQLLMNLRLVFTNKIESLELIKDAFKGMTFIIYSFLFLLLVKKDKKYVKIICWVHLSIIIFALLHHPLSPFSGIMQSIKQGLLVSNNPELGGADLSNEEVYIEHGLANRFRLSGPFAFAITYSYFAFSSFIINLYMFINTRKKFYLFILSLLIITAFLSQTRSLILAIFIILVGLVIFKKRKSFRYISSFVIIGLLGGLIFISSLNSLSNIDSRVTNTNKTGGGSDNRPLLWVTGLMAVLEHPFGMDGDDYMETKLTMFNYFGDPGILQLASHNGFVNVGFNYTIFGYLLMIAFGIFLYRNIIYLDNKYKNLFLLSILGYLVHSSFHNNFIFNSDYPILMVIMLIAYEKYKEDISNSSVALQ